MIIRKMKKKAGFDIQNYLVTFILVIGILVTFGTFAYNLGQDYDTISNATIDTTFQNTYDKLDVISGETEDIQNKLVQSDVGTEDSDSQFYGGALQTVKIAIQSLFTSNEMITNMGEALGVPAMWITIPALIIMILLFTTLVFMIFKL